MKIDYKKLIINILIPLGLGTIVGLLTSGMGGYKDIIKPSFAPSGIIFPIVWSILYILMGVSFYLVTEDSSDDRLKKIYYLQLGVNLVWSFIFFTFKWYLFAFIWILLLVALVLCMIMKFKKVNPLSAYLQIPYLLWIMFASILNYAIYTLN